MSVRSVAWVLHESPSTGNDRLVLIAIADEADDDGRNAFPSAELIAHKARVHRATVFRSLLRLEAAGELLIKRPEHTGRGQHNRYVVVMGRDPVALAGAVGWAPPHGSHSATDPQDTPNLGITPVGAPLKGAEWSHQRRGTARPGATRPVDPLTRASQSTGDGNSPPIRRGLDRRADPVETTLAAGDRLRARHDEQAAAEAAIPVAADAAARVAELRAGIGQTVAP